MRERSLKHRTRPEVECVDIPSKPRSGEAMDSMYSAYVPSQQNMNEESTSCDISVVIGTSAMVRDDPSLPSRIASMVQRAYNRRRMSESEALSRIANGDASCYSNRVLHLAFKDGELVGCCSSTIQPPWTLCGVGHWGLLAVEPTRQRSGVASALVRAAEKRLSDASCVAIQIEFHYKHGEAASEHLRQWYEGKLGFRCYNGDSSTFRLCVKRLNGLRCPPACPPACCYCCFCCCCSL